MKSLIGILKGFAAKLKSLLRVFLIVMAVLIIAAVFLYYAYFIGKTLTSGGYDILNNQLETNVTALNGAINQSVKETESAAAAVATVTGDGEIIADEQVKAFAAQLAVKGVRVIVSDLTGESIGSDGTAGNLSGYDSIDAALGGKSSVFEISASVEPSSNDVIMISAPIKKDGAVIGVLSKIYSYSTYIAQLNPSKEMLENLVCVLNGDGELKRIQNGMSESKFKTQNPISADAYEEIKKLAKKGKSGILEQTGDDEGSYVYYFHLDNVDGTLVFLINSSSWLLVFKETYITILIVSCILMFLVFGVCGAWFIIKQRNKSLLEHNAYYDPLTDLPNVNKLARFFDKLPKKGIGYIYVHLHIKNFSEISRTFGYDTSNNILKSIAEEIKGFVAGGELAAVLSKSTFGLFLKFDNDEAMQERLLTLYEKLNNVVITDGKIIFAYNCTHSSGILKLNGEDDLDEIRHKARLAELAASDNNMMSAEFDADMLENMKLQNELLTVADSAFQEKKIVAYMQPRYETTGKTVVSAEIYARWIYGDEGRVIEPKDFIPAMEVSGSVQQLDLYMLEQACALVQQWLASERMPVPLSVNISRVNLFEQNFVESMAAKVEDCKTPPSLIDLQFRQCDLTMNTKKSQSILTAFHQKGFVLSIDNFGDDDVPLDLLYKLPVDIINLSGRFLQYAMSNEDIEKVFDTVVTVATDLNIIVSANGIENEEQRDFAVKHKCSLIQGNLLQTPAPTTEFETMIF